MCLSLNRMFWCFQRTDGRVFFHIFQPLLKTRENRRCHLLAASTPPAPSLKSPQKSTHSAAPFDFSCQQETSPKNKDFTDFRWTGCIWKYSLFQIDVWVIWNSFSRWFSEEKKNKIKTLFICYPAYLLRSKDLCDIVLVFDFLSKKLMKA